MPLQPHGKNRDMARRPNHVVSFSGFARASVSSHATSKGVFLVDERSNLQRFAAIGYQASFPHYQPNLLRDTLLVVESFSRLDMFCQPVVSDANSQAFLQKDRVVLPDFPIAHPTAGQNTLATAYHETITTVSQSG